MPRMRKNSPTEAANKRARVSAWLVFISMAGTTMSFQVYHSIKHGHMPVPLAVLYGVVPLLISMLVIEVVSGWHDAPKWIRWGAYLIIGGAMYLSAAATGAVVLRAAPDHSSLLFGLLLDGAAILAARFLMTAVKRAAAAEQAEHVAALTAERERADAAEAAAEELRRTAAETASKTEAELADARRQAADATARAEAERDAARERVAVATGEADALRRELAEARRGNDDRKRDRKPGGSGTRKRAPETGNDDGAGEPPEDLDSEARVLWFLAKGWSASQAGIKAGLTDSRGRQIARVAREAPKGIDEGASS